MAFATRPSVSTVPAVYTVRVGPRDVGVATTGWVSRTRSPSCVYSADCPDRRPWEIDGEIDPAGGSAPPPEWLEAQRHAVDRIVDRYRGLGAVLLDPDIAGAAAGDGILVTVRPERDEPGKARRRTCGW